MNDFFYMKMELLSLQKAFFKWTARGGNRREAHYGNWEQMERLGTV